MRCTSWLCWIVVAQQALGCASVAAPPRQRPVDLSLASLYPLHVGAAWSYDVESGDGQPVLATARVRGVQAGVVELQTGQAIQRFVVRADGIARVGQPGLLLTAPLRTSGTWTSAPDTEARIVQQHLRFKAPAGTFDECLVVEEQNARSGQRILTTYCPGVGPARVISQMEVRGKTLQVTALLRGFASDADAADTP
jgi:hypothetical protein